MDRLLAAHLAWSALVLLSAGSLIVAEAVAACPPGGPLAWAGCGPPRGLLMATAGLAAGLYVAGLSGVVWWTAGLRRRRMADGGAARDWYLLAATAGIVVAPLLAFTLVSALR